MHDGEQPNLLRSDGVNYRIWEAPGEPPAYQSRKDRPCFRKLGSGLNAASDLRKKRFSKRGSGGIIVGRSLVQLMFRQLVKADRPHLSRE